MIEIKVNIYADALAIYKSGLEGIQLDLNAEVEDMLSRTDHYWDEIRKEMEYHGTLEQYIDMFDCADKTVLFNNYMNVLPDTLIFNYSESEECKDRAEVCFAVTCTFDLQAYCSMVDAENAKCEEKAEVIPPSDVNGWILTDDSCFQYAKWCGIDDDGNEIWNFVQAIRIVETCKYRVVACKAMKLSDHSDEYIRACVMGYYKSVDAVKKEYPGAWQQMLLECIFETDTFDCDYKHDVNSEKEALDTIISWISEGGLLDNAQKKN